jgi:hypothetical protein
MLSRFGVSCKGASRDRRQKSKHAPYGLTYDFCALFDPQPANRCLPVGRYGDLGR